MCDELNHRLMLKHDPEYDIIHYIRSHVTIVTAVSFEQKIYRHFDHKLNLGKFIQAFVPKCCKVLRNIVKALCKFWANKCHIYLWCTNMSLQVELEICDNPDWKLLVFGTCITFGMMVLYKIVGVCVRGYCCFEFT